MPPPYFDDEQSTILCQLGRMIFCNSRYMTAAAVQIIQDTAAWHLTSCTGGTRAYLLQPAAVMPSDSCCGQHVVLSAVPNTDNLSIIASCHPQLPSVIWKVQTAAVMLFRHSSTSQVTSVSATCGRDIPSDMHSWHDAQHTR